MALPLNIIRRSINSYQQSTPPPPEVTVIHCQGHQTGVDEISEGNKKADLAAKAAAREPLKNENVEAPLIWEDSLRELKSHYTPVEKKVGPC